MRLLGSPKSSRRILLHFVGWKVEQTVPAHEAHVCAIEPGVTYVASSMQGRCMDDIANSGSSRDERRRIRMEARERKRGVQSCERVRCLATTSGDPFRVCIWVFFELHDVSQHVASPNCTPH